jgi:lysophospholipase L1-like esterase
MTGDESGTGRPDGWVVAAPPTAARAVDELARPSTRQRIAPSIGLTVVAVVLTLLGRELAAGIAVLAALAVGVASFASDAFVRGFARVQHKVAHGVGVGLTWVLLVPVHYLVIAPVALIARLLRIDTLRPAHGNVGWQQRTHDHVERPRRGFADERSTLGIEDRHERRARTVRVVVAVLAVELAVFGVVRLLDERSTPVEEFRGVSGPGARDSAALRDQEGIDQTMTELGQVASASIYTPNGDQSIRDFAGQFVNVTNRERRSYTTTAPGDPFEVWFFGGSTMFGYDAQRDDHTIPSEVVRLAEAEGRPVQAHNFGVQGLTNYQETQILAQLLSSGRRADLIVFYDGINDTALQLQNALAHRDIAGEPGQLQSDLVRGAMVAAGLGGSAAPPSPLNAGNEARPAGLVPLDDLVRDVIDVYTQGVGLSNTLAGAYDIPLLHFWQPDLLYRTPLDPGEEALLDIQGMDTMIYQSMRAFWARVRDSLPDGTIDITTAFDALPGPVLSDTVHVNEDGARAVAAAMYPSISAAMPPGP